MEINILYYIFGAAVLTGLFSIILAVQNWMKLNRMTSNISNLEADIYKKSQEFDILRKKTESGTAHTPVVIDEPRQPETPAGQSETPRAQQPAAGIEPQPSPAGPSPDEIGASPYESYGNYNADKNIPEPRHSTPPDRTRGSKEYPGSTAFDIQQNSDIPQKRNQETVYPPLAHDHPARPETENISPVEENYPPDDSSDDNITDMEAQGQSDVLDIIDDSQKSQEPSFKDVSPVVIPLYSDASKDANFYNLWNTIHQKLPYLHGKHVNIDFSNILFIYEKELELLESIYVKLAQNNCHIKFINCSQELVKLLKIRKQLASLIDNE